MRFVLRHHFVPHLHRGEPLLPEFFDVRFEAAESGPEMTLRRFSRSFFNVALISCRLLATSFEWSARGARNNASNSFWHCSILSTIG
jgi:hypothetical protein